MPFKALVNPNGKNIENWMVEVRVISLLHENRCVWWRTKGRKVFISTGLHSGDGNRTVHQLLREKFADLGVEGGCELRSYRSGRKRC